MTNIFLIEILLVPGLKEKIQETRLKPIIITNITSPFYNHVQATKKALVLVNPKKGFLRGPIFCGMGAGVRVRNEAP
jgi:hypothetical protein